MTRNICQIMTYGGEDHWIRLGLREYPDTKRLILITGPENKDTNTKSISKDTQRPDYYGLAKKLIAALEEEEKDLPAEKKRKYHLLSAPEGRDHFVLTRFFRELGNHIIKNKEKIVINTTSGLQVWKLALYQIALEFRENIDDFYTIQKSNGDIRSIRIYRPLKEYEKRIIEIISDKPDITISEVQKKYKKKIKKGNLTFISRNIKILIQDKLIKEKKSGRETKLQLTNEGMSYIPSSEYDLIIKPLFEETP